MESNALLAVAAGRTQVGSVISVPPADLAREAGIDNRLAIARAVRALISRGRLEQDGAGYRLVSDSPLKPGEPASVRRPIRRRSSRAVVPEQDGPPTYEQVGRAIIERLIELSAQVAELRAALDRARGEAEVARREAVEVSRAAARDRQRAAAQEEEANALRRRLEMTEGNLRKVVEVAKTRPAAPLEDSDAKAILDILSAKGGPG